MREQRDVWLAVHRWLQWLATIATTIIAGVIISSMSTWDQLKANAIRMEGVPKKVDLILDKVDGIEERTTRSEWRIEQIEQNQTKRK